jgi:hypothetical protein
METKVKWEYLVVALTDGVFDKAVRHTVELKKYATLGWELVAVSGNLAYFKRPAAIELVPPQYTDAARFEAMVRKVVTEELGLNND